MLPFGPKALSSIELSSFGKANKLVKRLCVTVRKYQAEVLAADQRIEELESKVDETSTCRPDYEKLVVMLHGDGYVEVYGEKWHRPKVVHIPNVPHADEGGFVDLVTDNLPIHYRDLILPGRILANGHVSMCPTRSSLKEAVFTGDMMATLSTIGREEWQPGLKIY
jgi:hypothetical protein